MRDSDRPAFAAVMATIAETYQREISRSLMSVYFEALCDRSVVDVQRAVEGLIKSSTWLPRPAEIRDAIRRHEIATRDTRAAVGEPAPEIPADVEAQRRRERADPAVRTASVLRQAWSDRCVAVAEGLDEAAATVGFAAVLRELLPPKANDPWCLICVGGLVEGWQAGYRIDRPCVCPAGDPWREMAASADKARRWTVKKALEASSA